MSISISKGVRIICEEINIKSQMSTPFNKQTFLGLLRTFEMEYGSIHRYLIAKYFCSLPWNIGSLRVLSILQKLEILSATEYILSLEDHDQIQLILNDFLEAEYELLMNLFVASHYGSSNSVKLGELLNECLRRLYMDLVTNPNLNNLQYLQAAREILPANLLDTFCHSHLSIISDLHSGCVSEAFQHFTPWINEGVDCMKFTADCYEKLLRHHAEESLAHLFAMSTKEQFTNWKFYLILLQTIASKGGTETTNHIRKYLRSRFRHLASWPCKTGFLHLLLSARASTATTLDIGKNIDNYAEWYKQNIAEMKYMLQAEEFQNIIALLDQCVEYEMESNYIEVHAAITIAPPVLCGKLVQAYKSKCKQRLSVIKSNNGKDYHPNEIILLDDIIE